MSERKFEEKTRKREEPFKNEQTHIHIHLLHRAG